MKSRPRCLPPTTLAAAALALCAASVHAETSPYYIGLAQNFTQDSNLLRLANGQFTPDGYSRSDTVSTTSLLAGLDQSFGRQRLYGNLSVRDTRYSKNSLYNNTGYSTLLGLDWSTVERISGSVSANANRSLQSFSADLFAPNRAKNLESSQGLNARVSVGLVTEYSLELNGGHRQVRNSLDDRTVQSREFNQDNGSFGLRWRPNSAINFGLSAGTTQGRYPKFNVAADGSFLPDRFKRNDVELSFGLQPTGASTVEGRVGKGSTTFDINKSRNFSGYTGTINWTWQATGRTRFSSSYSRDTGQDSYPTATIINTPTTADYSRVSSTFRFQANYEVTAKISMTLGLNYATRDLVRTIDDPFVPQNASGADRTTSTSLGGRWGPSRNSVIGCDLANERRVGTGQLTSSLKATTFGCYGQLTLQ